LRAEVFSVEPVGDHAGGGHVAFAGSGEQRAGNAAQGLVRAHQVSKSLAARHQRASNVAKLTSLLGDGAPEARCQRRDRFIIVDSLVGGLPTPLIGRLRHPSQFRSAKSHRSNEDGDAAERPGRAWIRKAAFGLFVMAVTPLKRKLHLTLRIDKEGSSSIKLRDVS